MPCGDFLVRLRYRLRSQHAWVPFPAEGAPTNLLRLQPRMPDFHVQEKLQLPLHRHYRIWGHFVIVLVRPRSSFHGQRATTAPLSYVRTYMLRLHKPAKYGIRSHLPTLLKHLKNGCGKNRGPVGATPEDTF